MKTINMRKITFLIFIFSVLSCSKKLYTDNKYFDCNKTSSFKADTDKKQLIYAILKRAVVSKKDIPNYRSITNKKNIYVNDISYSKFFDGLNEPQQILIDQKEIPTEIENIRFCVKSEMDMQVIADKTDNFLYLTLGNIEINGEAAKIGLSNSWVMSKKNKGKYLIMNGGGYVLTFKKANGKWVFDKTAPINAWQS